MEEVLKYLSVYGLSGFKFLFGPTLGTSYDFPVVLTALLTAFGMMSPVYAFTFFGERLKGLVNRFRKKNRKIFSKKSRRFVRMWRKYGVKGIALATPLIFTPPVGAILVNVLGGKKRKIIQWMWISALFWGFLLSWVVKNAYWVIKEFIIL